MTTTALPTTGLDVIEALDFQPDVACEHSEHSWLHGDEPAAWMVRYDCPGCDSGGTYPICATGLRLFGQSGYGTCQYCGIKAPWRDGITVLGPVRA